ncbi:MAG: hypothetical protein M3342_21290 [Bacteroidota bacterium]|nr:hypothetical protein [Flavisolibacter sp.]MBD0349593.1 hypothetical protein [Flavisolibacter sp.]MBD0374871.1 hypothetical protein [Flavisolibacter sp.]MDQ3846519.1 hypothetical protein [Bacteroidota bacterium]
MKKIKLLLFSISVITLPLCPEAQYLPTAIKVQAMDMANALMKNDFNAFVKYMHPNIIAFAGGREKMKTKMDSAYQAMKRFNVRFKRYWIGSPGEIVTYKNQLQAVLPQSTTLITPLGELTAETSMIVISNDNGKNWWFIDTNVYKADKLKNILPDLSPKLVIPPEKKPKLVPVENN